jgi:hypothetical protein
MAEMINRDAPLSGLSSLMAMKGRQGDTELIHMTKPEIAGLASLGKLTINPDTGLPEAFGIKQILPMIANVGLGIATGGLSIPAQMAIMAAANAGMAKLQGGSTEDALLAAALGGASAGIGGAMAGPSADALKAGADVTKTMGQAGADATIEGVKTQAMQDAIFNVGNPAAKAVADTGQAITQEGFSTAGKASAYFDELTSQAGKKLTGIVGDTTAATNQNLGLAVTGAEALQGPGTTLSDAINSGTFTNEQLKAAGAEKLDGSIAGGFADMVGGKGTAETMAATPFEIFGQTTPVSQLQALEKAGVGVATGVPAGMIQEASIDQRKAYEEAKNNMGQQKASSPSAYGTRAADEIRQPAKADGLTTQEVLSSALGRSDPLTYLSGSNSSNVSAPSSLYGGPTGVVGMPAKGMGPVGGYVPQAASGGSLQDLYERMGGDIQTFKGLVEGGEIGSDGMSDDVEFDVIDGGEEGPDNALLSKDEYVIDAHTVAALGNGSTDAGADRLDKFVANLRNKAYNKGKQPKQLNGLKELATLMS